MEAGYEEKQGKLRFLTAGGIGGGKSIGHVCCLRRPQQIMFACTGMAHEIPRGTCVTARRYSISLTFFLHLKCRPMRFSHFWKLKKDIRGHGFASIEDVCDWVKRWFSRQPTTFFKNGINRLESQWNKCYKQCWTLLSK